MRVIAGLGALAALLLAPALAEATAIVVAEFRWEAALLDPGVECDLDDASCEVVAPTYLSTYSLTGLWDDASPPPTLTGAVNLADGTSFDWLALSFDSGYFDQLGITGPLPAAATTTIFFDFGGETLSLSALLTAPVAAPVAATLSFDSGARGAAVPEPGTITLVGAGLAGLFGGAARRRNRRLPA